MLNIPEELKLQIKTCLENLNCCNRCILKYLGFTSFEDGAEIFLHPETHSMFMDDDEVQQKKMKSNPCRACLDILSDSTIESYMNKFPKGFEEYEIKEFVTLLMLPMSLSVRELSILIYLREKFPDVYKDLQISKMENTKVIFKKASSHHIANILNKYYSNDADFQVNISIDYEDENKETQNVHKLSSKKISRSTVYDVLKNCTDDKFKKYFPVPPNIPDKNTSVTVTYSSSTAFIGGRYLKFSREMGHTPFVVNDKVITELSVQDILFKSICNILGCDQENLKFTASGREDSDTRMIGQGRPFYIQIEKPKFARITFDKCREIEESILESNTVVVRLLQQVRQSETRKIKVGEQEKRKHYRALCKTVATDLDRAITTINLLKPPFIIHQTTPIRVLHRRTHMVRDRSIYGISATGVKGYSDLFYLDVITQAGTYVKEFVHGDFNRTKPNISEIIGDTTDVIALDVTEVELEWPLQNC